MTRYSRVSQNVCHHGHHVTTNCYHHATANHVLHNNDEHSGQFCHKRNTLQSRQPTFAMRLTPLGQDLCTCCHCTKTHHDVPHVHHHHQHVANHYDYHHDSKNYKKYATNHAHQRTNTGTVQHVLQARQRLLNFQDAAALLAAQSSISNQPGKCVTPHYHPNTNRQA